MLHYIHQYDVIEHDGKFDLCIIQSYLWVHLTFPESEIDEYYNEIMHGINETRWGILDDKNQGCMLFKNGDLYLRIELKENDDEDIKQDRIFNENYKCLEITFFTNGYESNHSEKEKAWGVYNFGPRLKDHSGQYREITEAEEILKYMPAHVELGCGPSIELGIQPLNYLHDVYNVTDRKTKRFVLGRNSDRVCYNVITKTEEMYKEFSAMYKSCFLANPNSEFYTNLKELCDGGYILSPIFTNNFDGVPIQLGIEEYYLRRYETKNLIPDVDFDDRAKALISIGCHADRRRIQKAARMNGLKVIHIDPEGYFSKEGFEHYPLEAIVDGDYIYREDSSIAIKSIVEYIKNSDKNFGV